MKVWCLIVITNQSSFTPGKEFHGVVGSWVQSGAAPLVAATGLA
jgi:hypothetical protein